MVHGSVAPLVLSWLVLAACGSASPGDAGDAADGAPGADAAAPAMDASLPDAAGRDAGIADARPLDAPAGGGDAAADAAIVPPPRPYPWRLTVGPMAFVVPRSGPPAMRGDYAALGTDPSSWSEVLAVTDGLKLYVGSFADPATFPEAGALAALARTRGLRVTVEVGGLRVYGAAPATCPELVAWLGPHTAEVEAGWIASWVRAGGTVHTLAMDHPLHTLRRAVTVCGDGIPVAELVTQLGAYMAEMTRRLGEMGVPDVELALIDTALGYDVTGLDGYAYHSTDPSLVLGSFRDDLAALVEEARRRGVRFTAYHADFGMEGAEGDQAIRHGTSLPRTLEACRALLHSELETGRLLAVEAIVRELGLELGVVVNANHQCHHALADLYADYPGGAAEGARSARDRTTVWLETLLSRLREAPDELIFQTWFRYPERTLPETDAESYLGVARALYARAVPERVPPGFLRVFAAVYRVEAATPDELCVFPDWDSYLGAGGDPSLRGVVPYAARPRLQRFTGPCP